MTRSGSDTGRPARSQTRFKLQARSPMTQKSVQALRADLRHIRKLLPTLESDGDVTPRVAKQMEHITQLLEKAAGNLFPETLEISLVPAAAVLTVGAVGLPLVGHEATVMDALVRASPAPVSEGELLKALYPGEAPYTERVLIVIISRIRRKLFEATGRRNLIAHSRKKGWCLADAPEPAWSGVPAAKWILPGRGARSVIART